MSYKLLGVSWLQISAASDEHPNELKFSGVLVRLDEPSSKPPNGSRGHKILVPKKLAQEKISTLIGMGVNISSELDRHAPDKKVGVIQKAWIEGRDLKVSGIIWKKDCPDAAKDMQKKNLGMSFEATNIAVEDEHATIWTLSDLCFTGATILLKSAAAYYNTSADALAASAEYPAATLIKTNRIGENMAKPTQKNTRKVAASADNDQTQTLVAAFTQALAPVVAGLKANTQAISDLRASIQEEDEDFDVNAEGDNSQDDSMQSCDEKNMKSSKKDKKDDEDDDDDEDEDIDSSFDEEDEKDELEDLDDDGVEDGIDEGNVPGHLNDPPLSDNKGRSVPRKPAGKKQKRNVLSSAVVASPSVKRELARLMASNEDQADKLARVEAENAKLTKQLRRQQKQISAAAERVERRSVNMSAALSSTIGKAGIDVYAMASAGEKLSIPEFDDVLRNQGISAVQSISLKNEFTRLGLLESGEVTRTPIQ